MGIKRSQLEFFLFVFEMVKNFTEEEKKKDNKTILVQKAPKPTKSTSKHYITATQSRMMESTS